MGISNDIERLNKAVSNMLPCTEYERRSVTDIVDDLFKYTSSSDKGAVCNLITKLDKILFWDFNKMYPVSRQALSKAMHNIYCALTGRSDSDAYNIARFIEWEDSDTKRLYNDAVSRASEEFIPTINHILLIRSLFDSYISDKDSLKYDYISEEYPESELNDMIIEEKGNEKTMETNKVMLIEVSMEDFSDARDMINMPIFDECDIRIYQDLSAIAFHLNRFIPNNDKEELEKAIKAISNTFLWSFSDYSSQFNLAREALKKILGAFCSPTTINILTSAGLGDENEDEFYNCVSKSKANASSTEIEEYSKFLKLVVASLQYFKQLKAYIMDGGVRVIYA